MSKVVPREATPEMLKIAEDRSPPFGPPEHLTEEYCAKWKARQRRAAAELWQAMYDAAPTPPPATPVEGAGDAELDELDRVLRALDPGHVSHIAANAIRSLRATAGQQAAEIAELTGRDPHRCCQYDELGPCGVYCQCVSTRAAQDAIAALTKDRNEWRESAAGYGSDAEQARDRIVTLESALAACRGDAERYRWLRGESQAVADFWWDAARESSMTLELMDAAIDAAIRASREAAGETGVDPGVQTR